MSEENELDPPPKVIEPPQRTPKVAKEVSKEQEKPPAKDEKQEKEGPPKEEKLKRETASREEKIKKSPTGDKHLNEKTLLMAGIPLVVIAAIIAQYIYHNFYIIPLGERTLFNIVNLEINQMPWIVRTNESQFSLIHNTGVRFIFDYPDGKAGNAEFVWINGNERFCRLGLDDGSLETRILFTESNWVLSAMTNTGSRFIVRPNIELKSVNNSLVGEAKFGTFKIAGLERSEPDSYEVKLSPGKGTTISFNAGDAELNSFAEGYDAIEAEYDENFEQIFQLKAKLMPEFYQNMGKAALSLVLSSLYTEDRVFDATGFHNSRFSTPRLSFTHLHFPEGCEDLRTQGLAALSIIDLQPTAVLKLITSWTNLVNSYGTMPANVSGILDYKTKYVPALFVLLDEYMEKNGVGDLQPLYPNVEKLGLSLLEAGNTDLFEATATSFFFEPIEQTSEKLYTVELHVMMVKASRVLKRMAVEFGSEENMRKFMLFNEAIDTSNTLDKFLTEEGLHSDFVLKKNGKTEKEFITARISLAPLIFQMISPVSKEMELILQKLGDPEALWSNYGIRSHDGVSISQNYMILKVLNYYAQQSSLNQETAHGLYARLRNHLITLVAQEFKKSKTFWEMYSYIDGRGQGRRDWLPSATILKIMAELY